MRTHRLMPSSLLVLALASTTLHAAEPVATVRIAFDRAHVTDVQATGHADLQGARAVTADDPVRIASISKLVVALGVMRLVETGALDLDADVSALLGWRLRHPVYPDVPITLRLLLSHQAGLTDDAGYWQVPLDGALRELLADPRAWDAAHAPGQYFRYANLNFPIVASVMERATGERFDLLMQRLLFAPLGLSACYGWASCDDARVSRAVILYDSDRESGTDDMRAGRPACAVRPASDGSCDLAHWQAGRNGALFSPQGGLRISARELATIGRLLLGDGEVDGVRLLSPASVATLLAPAWTRAGDNGVTAEEDASGQSREGFFCRYGLAAQTLATAMPGCRDDPFGDGRERVGHAGSAYGLLSGLWLDRADGTGVVYFATGMHDAAPGTRSAFTAIEERLAAGGIPAATTGSE
ncbi:serine hydrolase domain-containing protein [Luteimonas yindakuii]|uniref:serine hydrolase domain-containing protein n=1 Tax=Luteimonas yindakuii TaxID=2565782 RepID=UPI001ABDBD56|nr:serine hydrolase domain-containing protein [Luteimonas yindakuii]